MKRHTPTFLCAECEEVTSVSRLSDYSLEIAGTDDKEEAVLALQPNDIICRHCDELTELDVDADLMGEFYARNDVEEFNIGGVYIDPAILTVIRLNW